MNSLTPSSNSSKAELDFQEKMRERLRQAMGDLMPDEVLAGIVSRGIDEAFFKKRIRPNTGRWNSQEGTYESWLVEFIEKETKERVQIAVKKWIAENSETIQKLVDARIAQGLGSAVIWAFDSIFKQELMSFRSQMSDAIKDLKNIT